MKRLLKNNLIPFGLTLLAGIISCIVYSLKEQNPKPLLYIQALGVPFILMGLFLLVKYRFVQIPLILFYGIAVHLILAVDFGTVLGFYDKLYFWDLLAHGYFGFICSFLIFILFLNFNRNYQLKTFHILCIFLMVLGVAAMWEIFEFFMDGLLHGDAQRVQESIALGHTPIYDTMMDIIITVVGILLFYFVLLVDYAVGKKFYNYLNKQCLSKLEDTNTI